MALMIRLSITDVLLMGKLISNYMRDNNITNINDIDEKQMQKTYDEIMEKQMWKDPEGYMNAK